MTSHTLINGYTLNFDKPPAKIAAFLARLQGAVEDDALDRDAIVSLVYGPDNPILEQSNGRAWVTRDIIDTPYWRVCQDLEFRAVMRRAGTTLEEEFSDCTLPVATAAKLLGLTPAAVRAACAADRLPGVLRDGAWFVSPLQVESYKVSTRGRPPRSASTPAAEEVHGRIGGTKGASLSIRVIGGELIPEGRDAGAKLVKLAPGWTRAIVRTTSKEGSRAFEIAPARTEEKLEHAGLWLRGPFAIKAKHNTTEKAQAAWESAA